MLLHESEEFKQQRKNILQENAEEIHRLKQEAENAEGEEQEELLAKYHALASITYDKLMDYVKECEEAEFKQIKGGAKGIIKHAQKLLPKIITFLENEDPLDLADYGGIVVLNQGTAEEKIQIKEDYAIDFIKYHLRLHIDALKNNQEALQELYTLIIKGVNSSTRIDRKSKDATEQLQKLDTFRRRPLVNIDKVGIMNDKMNTSTLLYNNGMELITEANGQMKMFWSFNEEGDKTKEALPLFMSLSMLPEYTTPEHTTLSRKIDGYDMAVLNTVCDIYDREKQKNPQANVFITPEEIWRAMNGKQPRDSKAKPSEAKIKKICNRMDKMRHTDMFIDLSAELKAKRITLNDSRLVDGKITDYLLNCGISEFTNEKGIKSKGYNIHIDSPWHVYNKAKGNIFSVPLQYLDTSSAINDSDYVTEFKYFLLRQINFFKHQEKQALTDKQNKKRINPENIILIATIYKNAGVPTPEERAERSSFNSDKAKDTYIRKCRKADRDKIEALLAFWVSKSWIKGFTAINSQNNPIKEKQALKGYKITL